MRSRSSFSARLVFAAAALTAALALRAQSPDSGLPLAAGKSPTTAQVAQAIERVKADPNLATERTIRTLQWATAPQQPRTGMPAWLAWLVDLFGWITGLFAWMAQSARILLWVAAALLAALLVIYIARLVRTRGLPRTPGRFVAPSHVRDLDIRPESLPDDIGAAARELWDSGEHRAALALLYRGLLSRLVHVHGVPIRDSSTEGDCLARVEPRLSEDRKRYVSGLVRVWQRAVYGGQDATTPAVHELCAGFAAALNSKTDLNAGRTHAPVGQTA